jgi:DNA modification methylase
MKQDTLSLNTKKGGPVECLGQKFDSEEARREHYLKLLAQKLKDPEFRKIEGFPIGKDEDILALSDPPYYTACPNPWIGEFIKGYGTPYDPKKPYHREPFAADVSEGKNHPIYNAHSYHTKVPHRAIMRYLLHYTQPGDVVLDGFCGTGMTGVAAQLCGSRDEVLELGYRVQSDGTILNEDGKPFSKLGARRAILNDLSPAATFIAYNYNVPVDVDAYDRETSRILKEVEDEYGWMFRTKHSNGANDAEVNYIVWSDVFVCPECSHDVVFFSVAVDRKTGKVRDSFKCEDCGAVLKKSELKRRQEKVFDEKTKAVVERAKQTPVLVNYKYGGQRYDKSPTAEDLKLVAQIEGKEIPYFFPSERIDRDIDIWYERDYRSLGLYSLDGFFTKRNLFWLAAIRDKILHAPENLRQALLFAFTGTVQIASRMSSFRYDSRNPENTAGGILKGALYIPSLSKEARVTDLLRRRQRAISSMMRCNGASQRTSIISTASSTALPIANNSLDYLFLDPPFGSNIIYSELSLVWESWLKIYTQDKKEAVVHRRRKSGTTLDGYQSLMKACFAEAYRILKPGRWMTVEFSNTQASVWNSIQTSLQEVGFVVANVSALDKQAGSFRAVTTTTAVKQDLIISAYKPNGGLEDRFAKRGETEEGAWDFILTHLKNLPIVKAKGGQLEYIAERDPRILYDRMVAFYVGHTTPVPLSSAEFQAGLAEKFPERDGMYFLPEQVNEYDKKRAQVENIGQLSIFVEDERSAINWLRNFLKTRPSVSQDIQPEFMQQLGASWKKWEARPEMSALLDQNFLCYEGTGEVPSQIHAYLSTQFKELRNLAKDSVQLKGKAKNRWYVPDPKKNVDVETLRNKRLLEEFWSYLPEGYTPPSLTANKGQTLPGLVVPRPKVPKGKKLKELRTEAVRVGFKHCYQQKDYTTILVVADMIPESVLNEDEQLQMIYDTAVTRSGGE